MPQSSFSQRAFGYSLAVCMALAAPVTAYAESAESIYQQATAAYNSAVEAGRAGRYAESCQGFKNAAVLYENSIYALMDQPMRTDEDRNRVRRMADSIQSDVDDAKRAAVAVCKLR